MQGCHEPGRPQLPEQRARAGTKGPPGTATRANKTIRPRGGTGMGIFHPTRGGPIPVGTWGSPPGRDGTSRGPMRASRGGAAVKGPFVPGHAPRPAVARRRPGREGRRRRARAGPRASVVATRQGQGTRRGPPHGIRAPWGACAHSAWLSLRACPFPPCFRVFRGARHRGLRVPSGRSRFSWWQDTSGCSSPCHLGVSGCPPGHLGGRGMTHGIRAP